MKIALNIALFFFMVISDLFAQQAGQLDASFNPTDVGNGIGDGASYIVRTTVLQPDGKILIGGEFVSYNERGCLYIARLNSDGTYDTGFNPGLGPNGVIYSIALQPDGKIIIGGDFTSYNTIARNRIARLNSNGSLDTGFDPGSGANAYIYSVALQADGKVIIGGDFTAYDGIARNRVARLNASGSLDTGFNPGTGASHRLTKVAVHTNGKILIGGVFTSYNNIPCKYLALLNVDGSLDTSFNSGTGPDQQLATLTVQPDGKVIIGGYFYQYNGIGRRYLARLNPDGSLDTGFNPGTGGNSIVNAIAVQPDGKIVIGGYFTSFNNTGLKYIARLNANGSIDTNFNPGTGASKEINTLAVQADGKIIMGGSLTSYNGSGRLYINRCLANGSPDLAFNPGTGLNDAVWSTIFQPDGKIIIGGEFTSYFNTGRNHLARLNADGTLDPTFNPGLGADLWVRATALQPDGKILIGGWFTSYNGVARLHIARVNADGSLDTNFNPGTGTDNWVHTILVQPDGKIIITGAFSLYNGSSCGRIVRLNADGSLDTSFNPTGTGADHMIHTASLQPDGKILIGGHFTSYNGTIRNKVARLNADGSLDTGFNVGQGANNDIYSFAIQANGKILIGGDFTSYNGAGRNRIARLNADGTLDTSFNPYSGADSGVLSMGIQGDGKIIIGGNFNFYNNIGRLCIARLNNDGTLDFSFNPGSGAHGSLVTIALTADGKAIIGGLFTKYNGIGRNRLARIHLGISLGTNSDSVSESLSKLSVYPNPVKLGQDITLKLDESLTSPGVAYVFDALGRQVMHQKFTPGQTEILLKTIGLSTGIYHVNVKTKKYIGSTNIIIQ